MAKSNRSNQRSMTGKSTKNNYMVANYVMDATKKRSILLTVCGEQTFKLLRSLVPNGKLDADNITYNSLVQFLHSHYKKKHSVIVHRSNFNTRS